MPASPARIALSLNDGVVLSKADPAIKTTHPNAVGEEQEIESFFDTAADAQVLLDERWAYKSVAGRPHEQIEVNSSFGLGTQVALTPAVPRITLTDEDRGMAGVSTMVRAYAIDYNNERYAVELLG